MMYKSLNDYIDARNTKAISKLRSAFATENLALLLGAGVSFDYNNGVSWAKLVLELFKRKFSAKYSYYTSKEFEFPSVNNAKQERKSSLLDIAEYSSPSHCAKAISKREIAEQNSEFSAILVEQVLSSSKSDVTIQTKPDGSVTLLYELAGLVFDKAQGKVRIKNIITYNYDDYMEAALLYETTNCSHVNIAVVTEENTFNPFCYRNGMEDSIFIYHVHGFIPTAIDNKQAAIIHATRLPESSKRIVLGEGSYNSLEYDDKLWTNSIQAQVNSQMPMLCVGFSCTDPNFRRLFASIRRSSGSYPIYALINADEYKEELSALLSINKNDVTDEMVICYLQIIEEYYFVQYEITIIWAKDFSDMPSIIKSIST